MSQIYPHIINLNNTIDQLKHISENSIENSENNENDLNRDCEEIRVKLQELRDKQLEMNESYDKLLAEYDDMKKCIINVCDIFEIEECDDVKININNIQSLLMEFVKETQHLSQDLESMKHFRSNLEENIYRIIEIISDIELELELLGRSPKVLNSIIKKFSTEYQVNNSNGVSEFLPALKKLLIQIYRNQLKWIELNSIKQIENAKSDDVHNIKHTDNVEISSLRDELCHQLTSNVNFDNKFLMQNMIHLNTIRNLNSEEKLDSHTLNDEIDINCINYILLSKVITQTKLEMVNEEEEEVETSLDITKFANQCQSICNLSDSKELRCYETDEELEISIKQLIDDLLNKVDKNIANSCFNKEYINTAQTNKSVSVSLPLHNELDLPVPLVYEMPFAKVDVYTTNSNNHSEQNENLDDSAFVSDDNCSSPENPSAICYSNAKHNLDITYKSPEKIMSDEMNITLQNSNLEILNIKMKELEKQKNSEQTQLLAAKSRIYELENMTNLNFIDTHVKHLQTDHYYNDELTVCKQLVDHQKHIMHRIMSELEEMKSLLKKKNKEISLLKMLKTNNAIKNEVETQTDAISHDNSIVDNEHKSSNTYSESDYDLFGLNQLFFNFNERKTSDCFAYKFELKDNVDTKQMLNKQNLLNESNVCDQQFELYSAQCDHNSNLNESIENLYSIDSDKHVSISTSNNFYIRKSAPSIKSDEFLLNKKHSCHSKVVYYGDHPHKRRLQLKKVELIYNPEDKMKPKLKEKFIQR